MSTRSTTHFTYGDSDKPIAIIYRHSDGYPEGAGIDLKRFLEECSQLPDSRFSDPSYLAAKYVVWLADKFNQRYDFKTGTMTRPASRLEFLSVGVLNSDPGDIEYRYIINCGKMIDGKPELQCYELPYPPKGKGKLVMIPEIPVTA